MTLIITIIINDINNDNNNRRNNNNRGHADNETDLGCKRVSSLSRSLSLSSSVRYILTLSSRVLTMA